MVLFCHVISSGGGGGCHMVLFPAGEVLLWGFFRGEGLSYGIPSWGTFAIWYNFRGNMKFVWGKIYHRGVALPYGIVSPMGKFCPWDFFRGKVCHMVFLQGEFCHMV